MSAVIEVPKYVMVVDAGLWRVTPGGPAMFPEQRLVRAKKVDHMLRRGLQQHKSWSYRIEVTAGQYSDSRFPVTYAARNHPGPGRRYMASSLIFHLSCLERRCTRNEVEAAQRV